LIFRKRELPGMRSFLIALAFLTIIPIRFRKMPTPAEVARSRLWYPLVALLLGLGLAAAARGLVQLGAPLVTAFLLLLAWVVVTGALHLDGFCDLCDGLLAGQTPAERLQILKDPHLGTFALAGGALLLLGKFVALETLLQRPAAAPWLVGLAVVTSRCLALWMAGGARYPRPEGTGKVLIEATSYWEGLAYALLAAMLVAVAPLLTGLYFSIWLLLPPVIVLALLRLACHRRLGGVTGDCLGAAIEAAELAFLLTAAIPMASGLG
jgi:adenosylcobinamide-GDP ribazoletransferase